jgi:hypothetical protein
MPLDHSKATVTLSVAGLALACINRRKLNRCEIGILRCDRHKPVLDIQKIELDPESGQPLRSSLIPHSLNLDEDISINVVYPDTDEKAPCQRGTTLYTRREFNRLDDTGDDEDFRWIADLEGEEFHNRKLKIRHRSKLKPTLFIGNGILYTRQKTDESFARVSVKGRQSPAALGKLAYGINADITCLDKGEIIVSNCSESGLPEQNARCLVRLPRGEHIKYLMTIENHCQLADEAEGTDFRLFYEVLKDPERKQFDLRRIVETGCYAAPEETIEERKDFSLDGFPQNCITAFLGSTESLVEVNP